MATSEVGDTLGPLTGPTSSAGSSTQSGASTRPLTGPQSAPARPVRLGGIGIGVPQGQHAGPGFGARTKSSVQAEVHETTGVWPHVIAICLLAYVGVLTRVVLEKATDRFHTANPCTDIRAPASQESELFNGLECAGQLGAGYWLPNIVGCIVMGIFLRVSRTLLVLRCWVGCSRAVGRSRRRRCAMVSALPPAEPLTKKWPVLYTGTLCTVCVYPFCRPVWLASAHLNNGVAAQA